MGLWARLPFAVSTGLEMNGYVVFTVIAGLGFTWPQALGLVFWSGALMTAVTVASVREKVIDSIPDSLKIGLSFSVGMFLILIALKLRGILEYKGLMISGVGSFITPGASLIFAPRNTPRSTYLKFVRGRRLGVSPSCGLRPSPR
jgi:adenine/guanine/hypoxanthine permease